MTDSQSTSALSIRIGTRGSQLARWQADWVANRLRQEYPELHVELVEIKTQGDRDRNSPLSQIGGQGLFTKEIQRALLEGMVDLAVHSLKDLPTAGPEGLVLAAVPPREETADALIAPRHRTLEALPPGARVGTGSTRRQAQLLSLRPDLHIEPLRGNVETRLRQALDGPLDAVVLALAGLNRLGLEGHVTERLESPRFLPAVGQGALGLECRELDQKTRSIVSALDCDRSHRCVRAERRLLSDLQGGCMVPLGALAETSPDCLNLHALVLSPDGRVRIEHALRGPIAFPEQLGREMAALLISCGASDLLRI